MKKILGTIVMFAILFLCLYYRNDISVFVMNNISQYIDVKTPSTNEYTVNYDLKFAKNTDDFKAIDKQEIINIIYTILNSGQTEYSFYCDISYKECKDDLINISKDDNILSTLNNMVSPFNSYEKFYISVSDYGKATVNIEKLYSNDEINQINNKIDQITASFSNLSNYDKVLAYHDYIVNNSIYDKQRESDIKNGTDTNPTYSSHKATGPLLQGYGICSGYTDAMQIYLNRLNIPNYKIYSDTHIWNAVFANDMWLHLDMTWDDPVTTDGSNMLTHDFFLISSAQLFALDDGTHNFNTAYYPEFN